MKTTLTTLLLSTLLLVGCMDNSSDLTSSDVEINQQSNSPNWVKLPADLGQGFGVETEYSASELIKGDKGGVINLNVRLHQHGSEFGDHFVVKAKVKIKKHSFPDEEEKLFTITMDPDNAYLNISPSPSTLDKHIKVSWMIKGIDVSNINPDIFNFFYVGDSNEMLETSNEELIVDYNRHKIKVRGAKIHSNTPQNTPDGGRYGFVH